MFEELESIDWEALGAPEVPGLFRALEQGGDEAGEAASDLYDTLCDHGSEPAVAAALPFLVEAMADPRQPERADLSDTLWILTEVRHWTGEWPRAWSEAIPGLLALLDDEDPEVRTKVLAALTETESPDDAARITADLRRRWEQAGRDTGGDDLDRIDLAMAIRKLEPSGSEDAAGRWLTGQLDASDAADRLSAAAAVLAADPDDARAREEMAGAVRRGDVFPWEHKSWLTERGPSAAAWADGRKNRKAERVRDALALLEVTDDEERARGAKDAAFLVATWPSTEDAILPALARHMSDDSVEARAYARHALAACGTRSAPFADQIAELPADRTAASPYTDVTLGDLAIWALARAGDRRCVPHLLSWLDGSGHTGFDEFSSAGGHPQFYMLDGPALHEVMATTRPFAAELLPAVRERLRSTSDYSWCREMAQILQEWGEDAAAAVPELVDLLPTDAGSWASRALAEMGPAAAEAAPALRQVFEPRRGRWSRRTRRFRRARLYLPSESSRPRHDQNAVLAAAWAYWRVTGDAESAGPTLANGLDNGGEYTALYYLGDMGTQAPRCADRVRDFIETDDAHRRIYAARAYSRITGEPDEALRVFTETLRPIADAELVPPLKWVIKFIREMGPPAAGTVPLMRAALSLDLRLNSFGGWHAIDYDQRDRRELSAAVEAVSA